MKKEKAFEPKQNAERARNISNKAKFSGNQNWQGRMVGLGQNPDGKVTFS